MTDKEIAENYRNTILDNGDSRNSYFKCLYPHSLWVLYRLDLPIAGMVAETNRSRRLWLLR
jgi:hypothetical protein